MPGVQAIFLELENGVFDAVTTHSAQNQHLTSCIGLLARGRRGLPELGDFDNRGAFRKIRLQAVRHLRRDSEQMSARLE